MRDQKGVRATGFPITGLACAVAAVNLTWSVSAAAQSSQENNMIEQVVVTGSRLSRSGFDAPTPVTLLGEDEIAAEAPASIDTLDRKSVG